MSRVDTFNEYRRLLYSIAYRMLGSATEAEDILQEAYLRWQGAPETEVRSTRSYLSAVVTRLCIDEMRSARARREVYLGPWLPEPVLTASMPDMTRTAELAESLSFAFLLLLENLSPVERAVFLLREVFGYDYGEIAEIVGKSEANCRQMVSRSRKYLQERRPRFRVSREEQERVMRQFVRVCEGGDMQGLLSLLAPDVKLASDGGGKVQAALNVIKGPNSVARFIFGILGKLPPGSTLTSHLAEVNAQPGLLVNIDGALTSVITLDYEGEVIVGVNVVANPDKLRSVRDYPHRDPEDRSPMTEEEILAASVVPPNPLTGRIRLEEYDPAWPRLFEREAARIRGALGARALQVEHAGSTSVPGLAAKPLIDIVLVVADSADEAACVPLLEAAGYTLTIREPDWHEHRLFKGPDTNVNVHTFSAGCPEVERMLLFRDWLRSHPDDRELYERAKRELATREWKYVQQYADAKTAVVEGIIARASRMAGRGDGT